MLARTRTSFESRKQLRPLASFINEVVKLVLTFVGPLLRSSHQLKLLHPLNQELRRVRQARAATVSFQNS